MARKFAKQKGLTDALEILETFIQDNKLRLTLHLSQSGHHVADTLERIEIYTSEKVQSSFGCRRELKYPKEYLGGRLFICKSTIGFCPDLDDFPMITFAKKEILFLDQRRTQLYDNLTIVGSMSDCLRLTSFIEPLEVFSCLLNALDWKKKRLTPRKSRYEKCLDKELGSLVKDEDEYEGNAEIISELFLNFLNSLRNHSDSKYDFYGFLIGSKTGKGSPISNALSSPVTQQLPPQSPPLSPPPPHSPPFASSKPNATTFPGPHNSPLFSPISPSISFNLRSPFSGNFRKHTVRPLSPPLRSVAPEESFDRMGRLTPQPSSSSSSSSSPSTPSNHSPLQSLPPPLKRPISPKSLSPRNPINESNRAKKWLQLSGGERKKHASSPSYWTCLSEKASRQAVNALTLKDIKKDILRTFPGHPLFDPLSDEPQRLKMKKVPGSDALVHLLIAYALRNPSVGYSQSMNFMAALILLVHEGDLESSFWTFSGVIENVFLDSFHMIELFMLDCELIEYLIKVELPDLWSWWECTEMDWVCVIQPSIVFRWICTIFSEPSSSPPSQTLLYIWDQTLSQGFEFIFEVSLAIFSACRPVLLEIKSVEKTVDVIRSFLKEQDDVSRFKEFVLATSTSLTRKQINLKNLRQRFFSKRYPTSLQSQVTKQQILSSNTLCSRC